MVLSALLDILKSGLGSYELLDHWRRASLLTFVCSGPIDSRTSRCSKFLSPEAGTE